jgi:hypothetical protein
MKLTGENRRTRGKNCPSATLSTTNPTWTDLGSNLGPCGGTPAANRLSHDTASSLSNVCICLEPWSDDRSKNYYYIYCYYC